MAGRALSEDAMLAGLRDIRLPPEAAGGLVAEGLAALALGLLLALAIGSVLRLLSRARQLDAGVPDPLARIAALPEEDQRLALMALLKTRAPERFAELSATLYRPGGLPGLEVLRAEVQRHG